MYDKYCKVKTELCVYTYVRLCVQVNYNDIHTQILTL